MNEITEIVETVNAPAFVEKAEYDRIVANRDYTLKRAEISERSLREMHQELKTFIYENYAENPVLMSELADAIGLETEKTLSFTYTLNLDCSVSVPLGTEIDDDLIDTLLTSMNANISFDCINMDIDNFDYSEVDSEVTDVMEA